MQPDAVLIQEPAVDFTTFLGLSHQMLGYSPARAADASPRELTDAERFLSCLAALRDPEAPAGLTANLLAHVSFSVLVAADERDLLDILEGICPFCGARRRLGRERDAGSGGSAKALRLCG